MEISGDKSVSNETDISLIDTEVQNSFNRQVRRTAEQSNLLPNLYIAPK